MEKCRAQLLMALPLSTYFLLNLTLFAPPPPPLINNDQSLSSIDKFGVISKGLVVTFLPLQGPNANP